MRYYWRVFLWENGRRSTEYTKYTNAPIFLEDKLDETLDSGEIILMGMPIATKAAFPPKTKFRLERYTDKDFTQNYKHWDMIVEHDDVEEYTGCPDLCTHRVHLIEASAVAQGMHVDNIALTYELQDVDLNYRVIKSDSSRVGELYGLQNGSNQTAAKVDRMVHDGGTSDMFTMYTDYGTFENSYKYEWDASSLGGSQGIKNILLNHHALNSDKITFKIPRLYIYGSTEGGEWMPSPLFELNTTTRVYKILRYRGGIVSRTAIPLTSDGQTSIRSGPSSISDRDDSYAYCSGGTARLRKIQDIPYTESAHMHGADFDRLYETFPIAAQAGNYPREVSFSTDVLNYDQLDEEYTIDYEIVCTADNAYQDGYINHYKQSFSSYYSTAGFGWKQHMSCTTLDLTKESAEFIRVDTTIYCLNLSDGANAPFVRKGVKYSCYDLFRKAMLTCDSYLIDNSDACIDELGVTSTSNGDLIEVKSLDYPIIVRDSASENWKSRMKTAKMYETVLEQKNLWEVLIQIGYYLHAIPYLEFAEDGTDRFELSFRQLGDTKKRADTSTKLTVFNSLNLSEYFTQYDSYVTNLFSPQNVVEEWVAPKTSDSSCLVTNNTAEIQLKYPITEIVEFEIIYNGEPKNALPFIFEESIYQILTNADPSQITPAKGNSLYYSLGSNKILGLSYVAPSTNSDNLMALKYIIQRLFGVNPSVWTQTYTFNNVRFRVKYRTQDEMRITQFRPNLQDFMKNSAYEHYPHHEQYYGQQDKIIDSERFSANLFGKLIRVGNDVYQRQEVVRNDDDEKESGDLVEIGGEAYYVTAVENEYYPDVILQKVTYSKNFNQLSNIVTIPSEPRFYEVSERSKVRREVRIQEFFTISTEDAETQTSPVFMSAGGWRDFIKSLLFKKDRTLPNFAWTRFMADRIRKHTGSNSSYTTADELFPSNDFERTGPNTISPLAPSDHADCIVPLLHFPLHDGIVFEWDMEDNFKAGDYVDDKVSGEGGTIDDAYIAQQSLRYVDILGRADLFRFVLFHKDDWTTEQAQKLPQAVIDPTESGTIIGVQGSERKAVVLDKDNREEISINYQINFLHRAAEGDDDFITFPNLFGEKGSDLKACFLNKEQSMFNESVSMTSATILADNVPLSFGVSPKGSISIQFGNPAWIDDGKISDVKAITLYAEEEEGRIAYIVKNVARLPDGKKLLPWYIFPVFNLRTPK